MPCFWANRIICEIHKCDLFFGINFQVYVLNPKKDMHGLGYDPFKYAPEFRGMVVCSTHFWLT